MIAKTRSIISKRQAEETNQIPDLGMWFGVAPANHQEIHIWWIYEQQKHIKKHKKRGAEPRLFKRELQKLKAFHYLCRVNITLFIYGRY